VFEFGFGQIFSTINELANALRAEFYDIAAYLHDAQGRGEEEEERRSPVIITEERFARLEDRIEELAQQNLLGADKEKFEETCNRIARAVWAAWGAAVGSPGGWPGAVTGAGTASAAWTELAGDWYCEEVWDKHYKP
jgi:hypothetical protein